MKEPWWRRGLHVRRQVNLSNLYVDVRHSMATSMLKVKVEVNVEADAVARTIQRQSASGSLLISFRALRILRDRLRLFMSTGKAALLEQSVECSFTLTITYVPVLDHAPVGSRCLLRPCSFSRNCFWSTQCLYLRAMSLHTLLHESLGTALYYGGHIGQIYTLAFARESQDHLFWG